MSIARGVIAFLEALDGGRTAVGTAGDGPPMEMGAASTPVLAPLGAVVEALAARVASLEAQHKGLASYVDLEVERAIRQAQSATRAVSRLAERIEGGPGEPGAGEDVQGDDAPGGQSGGVLPMRGPLAGPSPDQAEQVRAAARRALAYR